MVSNAHIRSVSLGIVMLCGTVFTATALAAQQRVTFFYPGSASWERLLISESHDGAQGVRNKKTCQSCHGGDQVEMGREIATNTDNLFHKEAPARSSIEASLQVSIDADDVHFQVSLPGVESGQVSMLFDNGGYMHTPLSGCWSACHDDTRGMASSRGFELTKYLSVSRTKNTRTGGGESYKSPGELEAMIGQGQYLELIGASFTTGSAEPVHGYVLEARHMDESHKVSASVSVKDGATVVEISRPLTVAEGTYKAISRGGRYSVGLALHLPDSGGANHLVTMAYSFEIDSAGDVRFITE